MLGGTKVDSYCLRRPFFKEESTEKQHLVLSFRVTNPALQPLRQTAYICENSFPEKLEPKAIAILDIIVAFETP